LSWEFGQGLPHCNDWEAPLVEFALQIELESAMDGLALPAIAATDVS